MKIVLSVAFLMLSINIFFAQGHHNGYDSIYLQFDELNIDNFPSVDIPNHMFGYPTVYLERTTNVFEPSIQSVFDFQKINGTVKKRSKYAQFSIESLMDLHSVELYDQNGLLIETQDDGYNSTFYTYDLQNRLISKDRILNNNNAYSTVYEYNDNNQLTKISNASVEYDAFNRPLTVNNTDPGSTQYRFHYNNNTVKIEEQREGGNPIFSEHVYSENNNVIKSKFNNYTIFYCYNFKQQLIKKITFIDEKLNNIQQFEYNTYGDPVRLTFQFASDKIKGTNSIKTIEYKYDENQNKTQEIHLDDIDKRRIEYLYKLEYY